MSIIDIQKTSIVFQKEQFNLRNGKLYFRFVTCISENTNSISEMALVFHKTTIVYQKMSIVFQNICIIVPT